jgi:hypothetical protein
MLFKTHTVEIDLARFPFSPGRTGKVVLKIRDIMGASFALVFNPDISGQGSFTRGAYGVSHCVCEYQGKMANTCVGTRLLKIRHWPRNCAIRNLHADCKPAFQLVPKCLACACSLMKRSLMACEWLVVTGFSLALLSQRCSRVLSGGFGRGAHTGYAIYVALLNHHASARNAMDGKQLVANIVLPDSVPGENEELYRLAKRMFLHEIWEHVLRTANMLRHGTVVVLPGKSSFSHIVPRIGTISQDIKEQTMTAGVLQSYAVRCETYVRPVYRYDNGTIPESGVTSAAKSIPGPSSSGGTSRLGTCHAGTCSSVSQASVCSAATTHTADKPENVARDEKAAKAYVKNLLLYRSHLKAGLASCDKFRDPAVRKHLLETHGYTPSDARPSRSAAVAAFEAHGLQPFVEPVWDRPQYRTLMGGLSLVERMPAEELHVVRGPLVGLFFPLEVDSLVSVVDCRRL